MKKTNLILALCLSSCLGFAQNIYTIAGTGTSGFSGDGGFAVSAKLYYPAEIALDASGNVYVNDYTNRRIRKINISTGYISTVAGNGLAGYTGDGGGSHFRTNI